MTHLPGYASGVQYALVSLESGRLLEVLDGGEPLERALGLAAAAPELLRSGPSPSWPLLFERLGCQEGDDALRQVILISGEFVHIVERLPDRPNLGLIAVSIGPAKLGEVLSGTRARLARLLAA